MKPVFVGGCPRSGTTLLAALLSAHRDSVCIPEMQFKTGLWREVDWTAGRIKLEDLLSWIGGHWRFRIWNLQIDSRAFWKAWPNPPSDAVNSGRVTYQQAIHGVVQCYAAAVGLGDAKVWIDHTPGNVRHWHHLSAQFPGARLIHIVRDGRGVAASILPLDWGPNSVWDAAHWWPEWLAYGLAAECSSPDRVLRIQYEDLLRHPEAVLSRAGEILGLAVKTDFESSTKFQVPLYTREQHKLVNRPPDPSRAEAWKRSLTSRQIEIFESSAGGLLQSLGYDLEFGGLAKRPTAGEKLTSHVRGLLYEGVNRVKHSFRAGRSVPEYSESKGNTLMNATKASR